MPSYILIINSVTVVHVNKMTDNVDIAVIEIKRRNIEWIIEVHQSGSIICSLTRRLILIRSFQCIMSDRWHQYSKLQERWLCWKINHRNFCNQTVSQGGRWLVPTTNLWFYGEELSFCRSFPSLRLANVPMLTSLIYLGLAFQNFLSLKLVPNQGWRFKSVVMFNS